MNDFDPLAQVRPDKTLADLASEIKRHVDRGKHHAEWSLEMFRGAGELVIQAKNRVGHKRWLRWLDKNVEVGERQAQKYMRLAREWDRLNTNSGSDLDEPELDINEAMRLLSEKERRQVDVVVTRPETPPYQTHVAVTGVEWEEEPAEPIVVKAKASEAPAQEDHEDNGLHLDPRYVGGQLHVTQAKPPRQEAKCRREEASRIDLDDCLGRMVGNIEGGTEQLATIDDDAWIHSLPHGSYMLERLQAANAALAALLTRVAALRKKPN